MRYNTDLPFNAVHPIRLKSLFQELEILPIKESSEYLDDGGEYFTKEERDDRKTFLFFKTPYNEEISIRLFDLRIFQFTIDSQIRKTNGSAVNKNWMNKKKKLEEIFEEYSGRDEDFWKLMKEQKKEKARRHLLQEDIKNFAKPIIMYAHKTMYHIYSQLLNTDFNPNVYKKFQLLNTRLSGIDSELKTICYFRDKEKDMTHPLLELVQKTISETKKGYFALYKSQNESDFHKLKRDTEQSYRRIIMRIDSF